MEIPGFILERVSTLLPAQGVGLQLQSNCVGRKMEVQVNKIALQTETLSCLNEGSVHSSSDLYHYHLPVRNRRICISSRYYG